MTTTLLNDTITARAAELGLQIGAEYQNADDIKLAADPRAVCEPSNAWVFCKRGFPVGHLRLCCSGQVRATKLAAGLSVPVASAFEALAWIAQESKAS